MHHFTTALCACIMATVVVGGTLTSTPAEAAKTPTVEAVALKEATAACKAEAKEKKINSWLAGRRFVSDCVAKAVETHAEGTSEDCRKTGDHCACKAEAKGKKIRWPASRKFVSSCLSNALKDYQLDVDQLRRELVIAGLRSVTPEETGCLQNIYCEEPSETYIP